MLELYSEKILIADPKILAINIIENNDPLIDLRDQNIIAFGPSPEIENNIDYTKIRKAVYEKLIEAQNLLPDSLKFCLYEGYRSLALQEKIFNERYNELKRKMPSSNHEEIFLETIKMVSPIINLDGSKNIPPHSTGGAIDIYLINSANQPVDMGINTDKWMNDIDGSLSMNDSVNISLEAQKNRSIMNHVLIKVGFVNYYTEYWHWSYGDRYWAYHKKIANAIYGSI